LTRAIANSLQARSTAEVLDAVVWARENARRIEVRGAGSKAAIGRPVAADLVLDLAGMSGILDYAPAELVLTALAGTRLAEVETALAEAGQMLAFEPMDHGPLLGGPEGQATLGGIVAANVAGPRRLKDGAARDHFLGFEAVSGRGEAFKAGGKVVKNVTGYDLSKLVAGSWGTLCVLTEVTLKVLPRPETSATLLIQGLTDAEAVRAMSRALGSPAEVSGAAHLPAGMARLAPALAAGDAATLLRLEGFGPSVAARARLLAEGLASFGPCSLLEMEQTQALWAFIRDVGLFAGGDGAVWRVSAPPTAGPAILAAVQAGTPCEGFYDWAGGLVWLSVPGAGDAGEAVIRRAARAQGGHATLIRAPLPVRSAVAVFEPEAPALAALSRRVKAGFDPLNLLNPGRMFAEA
jgi:glycolate oxidase FAD binding subunit